ncbi:hypothetical protein CUJ84_pRLN1000426 (plasmid) [Rhizobium leguminosarum]|uniref:Uncharacterized protein n=1 Tax=Rhizobium leguminosarum TaxID=384 RepID=A0A2K9ZCD3_RHILE|nr:hypothetical protein CUJ84_pRLN1000426 [Rhizobium leguminosarum]
MFIQETLAVLWLIVSCRDLYFNYKFRLKIVEIANIWEERDAL